MNQDYKHPITSPLELSDEQVGEWLIDDGYPWDPSELAVITITTNRLKNVARQAYQAGADQELEACCEVLDNLNDGFWSEKLRAARRPKPPSLKEQALKELAWIGKHLDMPLHNYCNAIHTISRALEQLPDNE
jgi:hypothetical protein